MGKSRHFMLQKRFYKIQKKAEEKVVATGTAMPDDLHLMATAAGGMS